MSRPHTLELLAGTATAVVAALGVATTTDDVRGLDRLVDRGFARRRNQSMERAMGVVSIIGEPAVHVPVALLTGLVMANHVQRRDRRPRVVNRRRLRALRLLPVAASLSAIATHHTIKHFYHRQRPRNPDLPPKHEYAYPSGHTTEVTAVSATLSYLLARERMLTPPQAVTIAAGLPAIIGFARLYRSRHWLTDVVGGAAAGAGIAALAALAYELARADAR
jgi:membrane-associated phospholipid phosphatase